MWYSRDAGDWMSQDTHRNVPPCQSLFKTTAFPRNVVRQQEHSQKQMPSELQRIAAAARVAAASLGIRIDFSQRLKTLLSRVSARFAPKANGSAKSCERKNLTKAVGQRICTSD